MTAMQFQLFDPPPRPAPRLVIVPDDEPENSRIWTPRPYQETIVGQVREALRTHRSVLAVMPTGSGKTPCQAMLARDWPGRVLVILDRSDLIEQNREELAALLDEYVSLEMSDAEAGDARVVIASVPSIKGERLAKFAARHDFSLIIPDEAHHTPARSWRAVLDAFPNAKVSGWTATPKRGDEIGQGNVYESAVPEYTLTEAWQDAWLTEIEVVTFNSGIGLDRVDVSKGRFVDKQLDDAVAGAAAKIATALLRYSEGVSNLTFTPGVQTAHVTVAELNRLKPGCARAIDGTMDPHLCRRIIDGHASGEFNFLLTCQKLLEGHNNPRLRSLMVAAAIRGYSRFKQQVGRVLRLWPKIGDLPTVAERLAAIAASPKPKALLIDPNYNTSRHDLASPVDLLGGLPLTEEERTEAKNVLRERGGSPQAAVDEARNRIAEREARRKASAARAAAVHGQVYIQREQVRPLLQIVRVHDNAWGQVRPEDMATPRQKGLLRHRGIPVPGNCSKQQFRKLIGIDEKRKKSGMCSLGAVHWLARFAVPGWGLTKQVAERIRDAIRKNAGHPLHPATLASLMAREAGENG